MTETERHTRNGQVLGLVDAQVAKVETELASLARLEEDLHASQETIAKLGAENANLRSNEPTLDKAKRMARLRDNAATIDLEQGDARRIQARINLAKAGAIALGQAAKSSGSEILWALSTARRISTREALEGLLDFALIGAAGHNLETAARSVLELKDLEYYFGHSSATTREPEYQLSSLRQLREHFSAVRSLCEAEPDLIIPMPNMAEPIPAAEASPVLTGNQLGTLVQAITA
jgi:hypothetical protein